jgi:hypothetical protein
MDLDKDWVIDWLTAVAFPHAGISCLMGVERCAYVVATYSPVQGCAGPVVLVDCQGCHYRDNEVVLIESRGNEAPAQEGPFWSLHAGVLPVCVWSHMLLKWPLLLPSLPLNSRGAFYVAGVVPQHL